MSELPSEWILLAAVAVAIAAGLALVLLLLAMRGRRMLRVSTTGGDLLLRPSDARHVLGKILGSLSRDLIDALATFDTPTGRPDPDTLAAMDHRTLRRLLRVGLVEGPQDAHQNVEQGRLRITHVGSQVLANHTGKRPTYRPRGWPRRGSPPLLVTPSELLEGMNTYIDGKMKRYYLLFAVNGGAFAIANLPREVIDLQLLALGAIVFTLLMWLDIWLFGRQMRRVYFGGRTVFDWPGKFILSALAVLLVAGWCVAAFWPSLDLPASFGQGACWSSLGCLSRP